MTMKTTFAVLFSGVLLCETFANYDVKLSDVFFDGGFVFFSVNRTRLQHRLDEINKEFDNKIDKLFLPSEPVSKHANDSDRHVIIVGFGSMEAVAFDEALSGSEKQKVPTRIEALNIAIPYLTTQNDNVPEITFQMELFTKEGGEHIESNVVLPIPKVADYLEREENEYGTHITFAKDDLHFEMFGEHHGPCVSHGELDIGDVKEYEHELQISQSGPDFSVCDLFPDIHVDLCDVYRDPFYHTLLLEERNNVCQYWEPTNDERVCDSRFHSIFISKAMRELLLLDADQIPFQGVIQSGTYDIRLVFPCID